jgi:hypothetical protein
MNIDDLVNQALTEWDNETNCGENDPAFDGEVGELIDSMVGGLSQKEVKSLLAVDNPLIFVEEMSEPDDFDKTESGKTYRRVGNQWLDQDGQPHEGGLIHG